MSFISIAGALEPDPAAEPAWATADPEPALPEPLLDPEPVALSLEVPF
jgi:hypothetical protein